MINKEQSPWHCIGDQHLADPEQRYSARLPVSQRPCEAHENYSASRAGMVVSGGNYLAMGMRH